MKFTVQQATRFLRTHFNDHSLIATRLGAGEWSEAFAFTRDGSDLVLRLGAHVQDFHTDQAAGRFSSRDLPVPKVLEIGPAQDGYFAISTRVFGAMLDGLDGTMLQAAVPSIFATLDAIRETDISASTGYGPVDSAGNGVYTSWSDYLLDVADDERYRNPGNRIRGWRGLLESSPTGAQPFDDAYQLLRDSLKDCPDVRYLVHNDFLNHNVLTQGDRIVGVIDWANMLYGDFLYDLAQFTVWNSWYPAMKGIDWLDMAQVHYQKIGLTVPDLKIRLRCCQLHMGLAAQTYMAYTKRWDQLANAAANTLELASRE